MPGSAITSSRLSNPLLSALEGRSPPNEIRIPGNFSNLRLGEGIRALVRGRPPQASFCATLTIGYLSRIGSRRAAMIHEIP